MSGQKINIAVNRSLLGPTPKEGHMVWRDAYGFGFRPKGYVPAGAPKSDVEYNSIQIADEKIPRSFLKSSKRFNNCGDFEVLVYDDNALISVANPGMEAHFYLGCPITFDSDRTLGPGGTLGIEYFCGRNRREHKYQLVSPTALSIAREGRGLTIFLEYPDLGEAQKYFDVIDKNPDTSHAGEIIYKGIRGRKVVAIEAQVNRNFSRQNPELVRKNQLFAVWRSEDKEYEAMVREVLLGKGE